MGWTRIELKAVQLWVQDEDADSYQVFTGLRDKSEKVWIPKAWADPAQEPIPMNTPCAFWNGVVEPRRPTLGYYWRFNSRDETPHEDVDGRKWAHARRISADDLKRWMREDEVIAVPYKRGQ